MLFRSVLEHLLKSGAGTAFYEAVVPARRKSLTERFVRMLTARHRRSGGYDVKHDYLACIAAMGTQQRRMRR